MKYEFMRLNGVFHQFAVDNVYRLRLKTRTNLSFQSEFTMGLLALPFVPAQPI